MTVLSNVGNIDHSYPVKLAVGFDAGEEVIDMISCQRYNISAIGELDFYINNGLPKVFYGTNHMGKWQPCFHTTTFTD